MSAVSTDREAGGQTVADALELEIFRYAVESVVDELEVNITRTAFTPVVYEYKDYSIGLVTHDYRLLSQSRYNLPLMVADLGEPVRDAVEVIGADYLEPGDVFLTNYARVTGQHLNNLIAASPVYTDGRVAGYVAIKTHCPDVGGLIPGSISWQARSIFHEGIQYRGLKVVSAGRVVPEVLATIQANTWMPRLVTGDLMASIAACTLGVTRWSEQVAGRWSFEEIAALTEAQFAASAKLARAKVAELPDGEFVAEAEMDDSGAVDTPPLNLKVRVAVEGDRMVIDFSDLPPQVETPINAGTTGGALSSARVAFKSLLVPDRPADEGLFEPLEVVIPPGTVMSAEGNAPMGWYSQIPPTLIDLVFRAIGERAPELVPAGHHGAQLVAVMTGVREDGDWWYATSAPHGGFGATNEADGFGPLAPLMNGDNPRVADEITEGRFPIRVLNRRFLRNAGGKGVHRGGPGIEWTIEALAPMFLLLAINRTRTPPWGMAGGLEGRPGAIHLARPGSDRWQKLHLVNHLPIEPGTRVRVRTGGGGGWGVPPGRDAT
jgi:N-methylhydantoinase B